MPRDLITGSIEEVTFGAPAPKLYAGVRQLCRLTDKPKFEEKSNHSADFTEISPYLNMNFTKGWYTGFMKVSCGFVRGKEYTYGFS